MKWIIGLLMAVAVVFSPFGEFAMAQEEESEWEIGIGPVSAEVCMILSGAHEGKEGAGASIAVAWIDGVYGKVIADPSLDVGLLYVADAVEEGQELDNVFLSGGISVNLTDPGQTALGGLLARIPVLSWIVERLDMRLGARVGVNVEGETIAGVTFAGRLEF